MFVAIELVVILAFHIASKRRRNQKHHMFRLEQELRRREQLEQVQKQKSLTTSMVEGTILQSKIDLGMGQLIDG